MESIKSANARLNQYGNLESPPKGWIKTTATVSQCKSVGAACVKVLTGWTGEYGDRYSKPILANYVYGSHIKKIEERLAELERTREQREAKAQARKQREAQNLEVEVKKELKNQYPNIPEQDITSILRSFIVGSGRVGRASALSLEDQIHAATIAHVRHTHTNYESILSKLNQQTYEEYHFDGMTREDYNEMKMEQENNRDLAREEVSEKIEQKLNEWN